MSGKRQSSGGRFGKEVLKALTYCIIITIFTRLARDMMVDENYYKKDFSSSLQNGILEDDEPIIDAFNGNDDDNNAVIQQEIIDRREVSTEEEEEEEEGEDSHNHNGNEEEDGGDDDELSFPDTLSILRPDGEKYDFGTRQMRSKRLGKSKRTSLDLKFKNPVLDDAGDDLLPFNHSLVKPVARNTPRLEYEMDFLRFHDEFGLIHSSWSEDEIVSAFQRLVDIWAQANIRLRVHKTEILQKIRLSRARSLAYWYYVDYPRGDLRKLLERVGQEQGLSSPAYQDARERLDRRTFMDEVIGKDLLLLFSKINSERQGLLDWILGWPGSRTPWEMTQVSTMYSTFYYFYMNGGGETGVVRFRTGDCKSKRMVQIRIPEKFTKGNATYEAMMREVRCLGFSNKPIKVGSSSRRYFRVYERGNYSINQATRLMAHETGHSMKLHHPSLKSGSNCKFYNSWSEGELMSQVRSVCLKSGSLCRSIGFPELSARATDLPDESITIARQNVNKDLKQTPSFPGSVTLGATTELLSAKCDLLHSSLSSGGIPFVVLTDLPAPMDGVITRIRFKLSSLISSNVKTIAFAVVDGNCRPPGLPLDSPLRSANTKWLKIVSVEEALLQHSNTVIHYEMDVAINIQKGQFLAIGQALLAQRVYKNENILMGHLTVSKTRTHPILEQVMYPIDTDLSNSQSKDSEDGNEEENLPSASFHLATLVKLNDLAKGRLIPTNSNDQTCKPLIANYDILPMSLVTAAQQVF